jgi:hypothetical protein
MGKPEEPRAQRKSRAEQCKATEEKRTCTQSCGIPAAVRFIHSPRSFIIPWRICPAYVGCVGYPRPFAAPRYPPTPTPTPTSRSYAYPGVWDGLFRGCSWRVGDCIRPMSGTCLVFTCTQSDVKCPASYMSKCPGYAPTSCGKAPGSNMWVGG